ncbi:MAG: hypothetical protein ACJ8EL_19440, partial [Rhizomicrobium sp.]
SKYRRTLSLVTAEGILVPSSYLMRFRHAGRRQFAAKGFAPTPKIAANTRGRNVAAPGLFGHQIAVEPPRFRC